MYVCIYSLYIYIGIEKTIVIFLLIEYSLNEFANFKFDILI